MKYQFVLDQKKRPVVIGLGSFGKVYLAFDRFKQQLLALKILQQEFQNEIRIHSTLHHPNIVQFKQYYYHKNLQQYFLFLQYVPKGNLFQAIKKKTLSLDSLRNTFKQICQAILYLHQLGIMHRDIKPENILLTDNNTPKLCDFGFAIQINVRNTVCGTFQYMSPQMLIEKQYNIKSQSWALGILLYQMLIGKSPYQGKSINEEIQFPKYIQQNAIKLIKNLLNIDPQKRYNVREILNHNYIKKREAKIFCMKYQNNRSKLSCYNQNKEKKLQSLKQKIIQIEYKPKIFKFTFHCCHKQPIQSTAQQKSTEYTNVENEEQQFFCYF